MDKLCCISVRRVWHFLYCSCYNKLFVNQNATDKSMHEREYKELASCQRGQRDQGVLLLQHDWVDGWDDELERMNDQKSGRPYKFPESLIRFAETLKTVLRLPLRTGRFPPGIGLLHRDRSAGLHHAWHRECQSQVHIPRVDLVGSGWNWPSIPLGLK